jgi:hypothetical protein
MDGDAPTTESEYRAEMAALALKIMRISKFDLILDE